MGLPVGGESGEDDDEDAERLDQQMGDTGAEAEDVDERLWNDEDREEDRGAQVRGHGSSFVSDPKSRAS